MIVSVLLAETSFAITWTGFCVSLLGKQGIPEIVWTDGRD